MFASNYNYQHNLLSKIFVLSVVKQVFLIVTKTLRV